MKRKINVNDVIVLKNKARDQFLRLIKNPPKPNEALKKLFKKAKKKS